MGYVFKQINNLKCFTYWDNVVFKKCPLLKSLPMPRSIQATHKKNFRKNENWIPPTSNKWKLNFDGASKGNLGKYGIEAIIHNFEGNIFKATSKKIEDITNNKVELEALSLGLDLAFKLNLRHIIF